MHVMTEPLDTDGFLPMCAIHSKVKRPLSAPAILYRRGQARNPVESQTEPLLPRPLPKPRRQLFQIDAIESDLVLAL
jgi:hypothetical protein